MKSLIIGLVIGLVVGISGVALLDNDSPALNLQAATKSGGLTIDQ